MGTWIGGRTLRQWLKGGCSTLVVAGALSAHLGVAAADYLIVGELGDGVTDGEVVLTRPAAVHGTSDELARAPISHGRFRVAGQVADDIGVVTLTANDAAGSFKGAARFILEPGEIRIRYSGPVTGLLADGGPYNRRVVGVWQDADEYRGVLADYADVMEAKAEHEEGPEYVSLMEKAVRLHNELNRIRHEALRRIALSDDDPLATFFAIQLGGLSGTEALDRLDRLQAVAELPAAASTVRALNETQVRIGTFRPVPVGSKAEGFSALGLDGETYRLEDSLAGNEVVLIEFWASWCGPCRADVPNLKTAVEQYGERGFAIFAFSLDGDREAWEEASIEDGITWINTCDLKSYDGPIPAQFGVLMLPSNVLVDADGVIVGRNLRAERLLDKLSELLDA